MLKVLNKPYPRDWNISLLYLAKINGFIFLFVTFFLYLFKPSSIIGVPVDFSLIESATYGFISFITPLAVFILLPKISPTFCIEENWNVKKEFILNFTIIFSIAFFIILYGLFVLNVEFKFWLLLRVIFLTILIGVFPIFGIILYNQNRLLRKYLASSNEINKSISTKEEQPQQQMSSLISIEGEGKNESLSLNPNDILFIKSQSNYCQITYLEGEKVQKSLIRISLTKLFNQLKTSNSEIEKVHRSYLVNLTKVKNVTGNAQGYKLHFDQTESVVPVSRGLSKEVKDKIVG